MLTGLPCDATPTMKLVWRHRNAGVCSTSTTAATSPSGVSSCTSVRTGTPISLAHAGQCLEARFDAGSAKARARGSIRLVERGLEYERDAEAAGHFLQAPGDIEHQAFAFDDAGTGDQEKRALRPDLERGQFHAVARPRMQRRAIQARRPDEAGEQRMSIARRRGELRVKLARHEPWMRAQLDELHQAVGRESREAQAGRSQLVEIMIVEFIAVAMALEYRLLAVQRVRQGAGYQPRLLGTEPHAAARDRISRRALAGRAPNPATR